MSSSTSCNLLYSKQTQGIAYVDLVNHLHVVKANKESKTKPCCYPPIPQVQVFSLNQDLLTVGSEVVTI